MDKSNSERLKYIKSDVGIPYSGWIKGGGVQGSPVPSIESDACIPYSRVNRVVQSSPLNQNS